MNRTKDRRTRRLLSPEMCSALRLLQFWRSLLRLRQRRAP